VLYHARVCVRAARCILVRLCVCVAGCLFLYINNIIACMCVRVSVLFTVYLYACVSVLFTVCLCACVCACVRRMQSHWFLGAVDTKTRVGPGLSLNGLGTIGCIVGGACLTAFGCCCSAVCVSV